MNIDNLNKQIIQWGIKYLLSHGYTLKSSAPEDVQSTPWSYVVRFATSEGYIYLKHTPVLLALESVITQALREQFNAPVPEVIAHDTELNCFLMKDAGSPLREILKKQFDAALLCKAINQFTLLQLSVADHVNIFLDLGVPDWRLDNFPDLFKQLLSEKDILLEDGLSEVEINKLVMLLPIVSDLCKKLSEYSIKPTIVQPDFHDNNILIDDTSQKITLIDLGEIVISQPFFSLINFLEQMKRHHALTDKDDDYRLLADACLKNYIAIESKENLLEAFETARILWFIYEALANYRLMKACDKATLMSFQRNKKISGSLKEFISACRRLPDISSNS